MKLDPDATKRILDDFALLIKLAADSPERSRFHTISTLAMQANSFQRLETPQVGDFDNVDPDGGIVLGNGAGRAILGHGGYGDQAEMLRVIIDSFKDIRKRSPTTEISELLDLRRSLKLDGETTEDIDARIKALRKEICDAVVPADVLRGHQIEADGVRDAAIVGEHHDDGEAGVGVAIPARE